MGGTAVLREVLEVVKIVVAALGFVGLVIQLVSHLEMNFEIAVDFLVTANDELISSRGFGVNLLLVSVIKELIVEFFIAALKVLLIDLDSNLFGLLNGFLPFCWMEKNEK